MHTHARTHHRGSPGIPEQARSTQLQALGSYTCTSESNRKGFRLLSIICPVESRVSICIQLYYVHVHAICYLYATLKVFIISCKLLWARQQTFWCTPASLPGAQTMMWAAPGVCQISEHHARAAGATPPHHLNMQILSKPHSCLGYTGPVDVHYCILH